MDPARKIASNDELHAIAAAGADYIIDPFNRRWHLASCPHTRNMTTGQPKWLAPSPAALDDYLQQRHAHHPAAKPIQACPACGGRAIVALRQLTNVRQARNVDRVLQLHAEFSTGEIAAARNRFSELMWRAGEAAFKLEFDEEYGIKKGYCWQPTWQSLYPPSPGCRDAS